MALIQFGIGVTFKNMSKSIQIYGGNGKIYFQIMKKLEGSNLSIEDQEFILKEIERIALENQKAQIILDDLSDNYRKVMESAEKIFQK